MASGKADAEATFAVELEDGTSGPAEDAASALAKLQRSIDADTKALASMQKAMRNLQQGAVVNVAQFRQLKEQIDAKKASVAQAQSAYLSLGGTFNKVRPKAAANGFRELADAAGKMPGPLGVAASKLESLMGVLKGNAMAIGIAAVAAAVVALTAAAIAGAAALLKYGIAVANARRAEGLRLEGLTKMRNFYGVAAGKASDMQAAIDRVSASTTLGRGQIEQYAAQLYKMHLRGDNLSQALEGTAIKASALGDEAAKGFMGWAAGAAFAGQSVKRLSDDVRARFGGVVAAQMLDLDVQAAKLHESFAALFAGLKIEGLLKAVSGVTSLFSQSTKSGQALRAVCERVFQPLIDGVTFVAPIVKRFFQGIIIGGLLVAIGILSIRKAFKSVFSGPDISQLYLMRVALVAGGLAAGLLAAAFALVLLPFAAFVAIAYRAVQVFSFVWKWIGKGYDLIAGIDWKGLGRTIVEGIVNGLKGGAKWLVQSVEELGSKALAALKGKLGISSPSKAFARLGIEIPRGIETGVETGTPGARNAVANIVDAPRIPAAAADDRGAKGGGARVPGPTQVTVDVGGITIQTAGETAREIVDDVEREFGKLLERVAIEIGAMVPGSAA